MRITNNLQSLQPHKQMSLLEIQKKKQEEEIASGKKVNKASDDAAGLAIAIKLASQAQGLDMASRNTQDASSLLQTADGALDTSQSIIDRMRELTVQGSNASLKKIELLDFIFFKFLNLPFTAAIGYLLKNVVVINTNNTIATFNKFSKIFISITSPVLISINYICY